MTNALLNILSRFGTKRVLVIGDSILDRYINGDSHRLSPEAPVPVVDVKDETIMPGGAANTAINLTALGANVSLCTVIGSDRSGEDLTTILKLAGVDCSRVMKSTERTTLMKTRVVVGGQVLVRYDAGTTSDIGEDIDGSIVTMLNTDGPGFDAIVVSDYAKGVITQLVIDALASLRRIFSTFIAVDSRRLEAFASVQPSLVKPNYAEAIALLRTNSHGTNRLAQIGCSGRALYARTRARVTAVTLDSDGALIFEGSVRRHHAPALRVARPCVSGAGDTFISAFTLALIGGADVEQAAQMAITASAHAIQKQATAGCSAAELRGYFMIREKCPGSKAALKALCDMYHAMGRTIVFTNGCFDIIHSGHISYLNAAKALGDVLIVGINSDESITRLKGPDRPINAIHDRIAVLGALSAVDHIIEFGDWDDDTPCSLIPLVRPHVFAKGDDYQEADLPEAEVVKRHGGAIALLPRVPGRSTTGVIQKIGVSYFPAQINVVYE